MQITDLSNPRGLSPLTRSAIRWLTIPRAMSIFAAATAALTIVWNQVLGTYRDGHARPAALGIAGESPTIDGYLMEVGHHSNHSGSGRVKDAPFASSPGLSNPQPVDSFCALCPLPPGRITLVQRIRSWVPALLSRCCAES